MSEFVAPGMTGNGCDAPGYEGWIQTRYGGGINLLKPDVSMIRIEDIAHSLSMQVRYTGHTIEPYSVAEHSMICAKVAMDLFPEDTELAMVALLHDAAEAYVTDVSRPLKYQLPQFIAFEHRISKVVGDKFGVRLPSIDDRMKWIDAAVLATEKEQIMPPETFPWCNLPKPIPGVEINCYTWDFANGAFMALFHHISDMRKEQG